MNYLKSNPEYEEELLGLLPENLKNTFQVKLTNNKNGYWKVLAEARTVVIFYKKLNLLPEGVDVETHKNKDVDSLVIFTEEKVYIEVKGFNPDKETLNDQNIFCIDTSDSDIIRALKRSSDKFLEESYNIVVIADEDILNPLGNKSSNYLEKIFTDDFRKISAFIILGPLREKDPFESSGFLKSPAFNFTHVIYNKTAQRQLPEALKKILDSNIEY